VVGTFVGIGEGLVDGAELGEGLGIKDGVGLGKGVVGSFEGLGEGITEGLKVGSEVVGSLLGLGEGINEGRAVGTGVGSLVGLHVVHDNVNDTSSPSAIEPAKYSYQVSVDSGGVLSQSGSTAS